MPVIRLVRLLVVACLAAWPAAAHQLPRSSVLLDFRSDGIDAELHLPVDRLQVALRHDPAVGVGGAFLKPDAMLGSDRARINAYILGHLHPTTTDGRPWSVQIDALRLEPAGSGQDLVATVTMQPPEGAAVSRVDLGYDVIVREIFTQSAVMSVRSDWRGGTASGSPELVGGINGHNRHLLLDRSGGRAWRGAASIFRLGVSHIAEGTDHLLFLLTLLLPAPLLARGGRWNATGRPLRSLVQVARIVTAFTVGHSVTLLLGAVGLLRLPSAPVEFLIAASILVSAIHAIRPIFPGREFVVAAGFGLVHGASFATVIAALGLGPWGLAVGIAAFNLGIEAMQLVVVLATMPWLILLATTPLYPAWRIGGACFAILASSGWMIERASNLTNPVGPFVDRLAAHAPVLVLVLASVSVLSKVVVSMARPVDGSRLRGT